MAGQSVGNIEITSAAGSVTTLALDSDRNISLNAGMDLTTNALDAGNNISTLSGGDTSVGQQTAGGTVTADSDGTYTSRRLISSTGAIDITSDDTASIAGVNSGSTTDISSATSDILLSRDLTSADSIVLTAAGDVIASAQNITSTTGDIDINADLLSTGNIVLTAAGDLTTMAIDVDGNIDLNANLNLRAIGSLTSGGDVTADSTTGAINICLLYTSPSPRDLSTSRMPSSA